MYYSFGKELLMKKYLSILTLVLCLFLVSAAVSAESYKAGGECGADLKWSLDYDGNLFIYGEGEMSNYAIYRPEPPWYDYRTEIKTVTIEKGATSIGSYAFYNLTNLKKAVLPSTLKKISSGAFYECTSLASVNLPNGLTSLASYVFEKCTSLKTIKIPATLTSLGADGSGMGTFRGCGITNITIPSTVQKIASYCFEGCPNLKTAVIDGTALTVPYQCFVNCPNLETVKMGSGVISIWYEAFEDCSKLKNVTIGKNVTLIGGGAFQNCTALEEIVIPDKVTVLKRDSWGNGTFQGCSSLQKITLGVGVTNLEAKCFKDCPAVSKVYFCGSAPVFDGNETFAGAKIITAYHPDNKTWDRSNLTAHGAERIDWQTWTIPLNHFTPVLQSLTPASNGITLRWKKMGNAKGYEISRKVGNGSFSVVKKISSNSTLKWTDTGVSNGKRYTYRIAGIRGSQTSNVSGSLAAYYLTRNTITLSKSGKTAVIKWKSNASATGYQVQYGKKSSFSGAKTKTIKGRKMVSVSFKPGVSGRCYFRVRTYKTVNGVTSYSAWSAAKSASF